MKSSFVFEEGAPICRYDSTYRSIDGYIGKYLMARIVVYDGNLCEISTCTDANHMRYQSKAKSVLEAKRILESWWNSDTHGDKFYTPCKKESVSSAFLPGDDNGSFFPTPKKLAGKMLAKVDWRKVDSILEPSAGKGDLIEAVESFITAQRNVHYKKEKRMYVNSDLTYAREGNEIDIDCVEIDSNLRLILRGKGYHLVADDFLTLRTQKTYSLILMNPPFANGAEHLLNAIAMQKRTGGQIVCLLNAETIRNPYSNIRKELKAELAKYGASIEMVRDGFKHAERKTTIETAIVYLDIQKPPRESKIFREMSKAQKVRYEDGEMEASALVCGDDIDQSIQHFELEAMIGRELIEEYASLLPYMKEDTDRYSEALISLKVQNVDVTNASDVNRAVNEYLRRLRYRYWYAFLDRPEIKGKMTSKMSDDYFSKVKRMAEYDYSRHNIMQLCFDMQQQLLSGVEESILALFEKLSQEHSYYDGCPNIHYYNGWKTNKAWKVSNKAIIPAHGRYRHSVFKETWKKITDEINVYDAAFIISDLEKALNFLNKGEICDSISLEEALRLAASCERKTVAFKYFDVTFYKKGTAHIKFLPEAQILIDRLNIFAARSRSWLPPSYGKKNYDDMSEEEKAVIDDFQGKTAYEKVMAEPSRYILEGSALIQLGA